MTSFVHPLSACLAYFPLQFTRSPIEVGQSFCDSSSALHVSPSIRGISLTFTSKWYVADTQRQELRSCGVLFI